MMILLTLLSYFSLPVQVVFSTSFGGMVSLSLSSEPFLCLGAKHHSVTFSPFRLIYTSSMSAEEHMVSLQPLFMYPNAQSDSVEIKFPPNCFSNSFRSNTGVEMASYFSEDIYISKSFFFSGFNILTLKFNNWFVKTRAGLVTVGLELQLTSVAVTGGDTTLRVTPEC